MSAHDCQTTPVRLCSEQLKYTTAFMTRTQCTPRERFVNENVRDAVDDSAVQLGEELYIQTGCEQLVGMR